MSAAPDYTAFLRQKIKMANFAGFQVEPEATHQILFAHQRDIVRWAVLGGNRAIFASFGLGKSVMQCEWLRQILLQSPGAGLIICPLGVRQELIRDAAMLGIELRFIRSAAEMTPDHRFYVTNYETVRDGKLDPALFVAVSLDEASVLRSFGSKTYQEFLPLFGAVKFKLVNTATPSPNRFKELIHYAGFLGVMDTGQALTRFFQRDSEKAGNLTLYPHKEKEFWLWVSSWAVFVQRPSDLGYSDEGYDLPPIEVRYHEVPTDYTQAGADRDGQGLMFQNPALGLSAAATEKRDSLPARVAAMSKVIDAYLQGGTAPFAPVEDQIVLWCDLNAEQDAIEAALTARGLTFSSVYGSLTTDEAERRIQEWRDRKTYALIGKPVMLGQGMNLQQCNKAIFVGVTYKFNDLIQATHRIQRFGQKRACEIAHHHQRSRTRGAANAAAEVDPTRSHGGEHERDHQDLRPEPAGHARDAGPIDRREAHRSEGRPLRRGKQRLCRGSKVAARGQRGPDRDVDPIRKPLRILAVATTTSATRRTTITSGRRWIS